jgi:hypothetical protein
MRKIAVFASGALLIGLDPRLGRMGLACKDHKMSETAWQSLEALEAQEVMFWVVRKTLLAVSEGVVVGHPEAADSL